MILNNELERIWKYRQVLFYARVMFPKNAQIEIVENEHKFPI